MSGSWHPLPCLPCTLRRLASGTCASASVCLEELTAPRRCWPRSIRRWRCRAGSNTAAAALHRYRRVAHHCRVRNRGERAARGLQRRGSTLEKPHWSRPAGSVQASARALVLHRRNRRGFGGGDRRSLSTVTPRGITTCMEAMAGCDPAGGNAGGAGKDRSTAPACCTSPRFVWAEFSLGGADAENRRAAAEDFRTNSAFRHKPCARHRLRPGRCQRG